MTSHLNLIQGSSSRNRKSPKVNDKGANKKNLLSSNGHLNSTFNSQAFEIPAITTNGMKNIEHFIDKALVDGKQWYRCKWQSCTYSTIRSDSIVRHMRKHTGERPYKCWFCSYATIQSSALKIHMRRHTGERPYVCKYDNCGKRFAVLNTLVVHERTHTGYKPYKCSFSNTCNYSSSDRCKLVNHMRKSHQIELDSNKVSSVNNLSGQLSTSAIFPGSASNTVNSSSNSLALVSSAMSSSQLLMSNSMYSPFSVQNSSQMMVNNSLSNSNQLKHSTPSSSSPFMPLNLLTVISGGGNYENLQNTENSSTNVKPSGRSKRKSMSTIQANIIENKIDHPNNNKQFNDVCQSLSNVKREDNSIKRVMVLIDKRIANNRTSYFCKWPSCGYESLRSDSIVRHMRSHTGERPYKCNYENCNYATIQRSTLNKHLTRHQTNIFNFE